MLPSHEIIDIESGHQMGGSFDKSSSFCGLVFRQRSIDSMPKLAGGHHRDKSRCIANALLKRLGGKRASLNGNKNAGVDQESHDEEADC